MARFIIEGGHALHGTVTPGGNKNAALKLLPACLLTDEPVVLHNVPAITDVHKSHQHLTQERSVLDGKPPIGRLGPLRHRTVQLPHRVRDPCDEQLLVEGRRLGAGSQLRQLLVERAELVEHE